ncbi:uncharacterized protein LOC129571132 [Sitodiplosis mosellana]|uniref:uncharacterized protein LOC129571132 n=1 Tax=Sitodiplosis mosellana TaxID=263140 RepID=UPI002444F14B|nr:uncharacterized protein LOC129571132 [Sitodiplosis mosellana]
MSSENKKITMQQKVAMVDFMQENYSFLMGQFSSMEGRMKKNLKWKEFADVLNKLGPPTKDLAKWKKSWSDMKSETKKKFQLKRQNLHTSGAGPIDVVFSQLDERIVQICGKKAMDGDADINEIGFDSKSSGEADDDGDVDDVVYIESEQKTLTPLKTPSKKTPLKTSQHKVTSSMSRKRLFEENDDALSGFPEDDDTSKTPTKRSYRSQNNQVELALSQQEKQNMLLERIVEQNDGILDELKKMNGQLSTQSNSLFRY